MEKRIKLAELELLRGIAILAVLAIHTTSYAAAKLPMDSTFYPVYHIINTAANFAVPAFMFLSALLLFYHYDSAGGRSWLTFYRKRIKTIVVPYLLWSVFYSAVVMLISHAGFKASVSRFFHGLAVGGSYAHLYFIIVIAQFYAIFPLLHALLRIRFVRDHPLLCGAAAQTAFYLLNYYYIHMHKIGTFIGSYLLYLFLGAYAAGKWKERENNRASSHGWLLFTGFLLAAALYVVQTWLQKTDPHWIPQPFLSNLNFVSDYTYSAVSCLALLHFSKRIEQSRFSLLKRMLFSIGIYSFGIYFIHPFILLLWRLKVMNGAPVVYHLLTFAGGAVALGLSWLTTWLVQRTRLGSFVVGRSDVKAPSVQTQPNATTSA
ncbi:acyltransferase [Paenibacillus humicola]|uniref:acyltransferase n=1 Tax=Paenibacillus humicola TaxID=3110540 RepID=UPI00237B76EB|nr:acyltransferase [Paenibacillus humicola]